MKRINPLICTAVLPAVALLFMPMATRAQESATNSVMQVDTADVAAETQLFDPFAYHATGEQGSAYIPANQEDMPQGIQVLATLQVRDGVAYAVLHIPGRTDNVFVTEDDVVRIERNVQRRGNNKRISTYSEPIYLRIHKISHNAVEISPQKRPQEIHIFQ